MTQWNSVPYSRDEWTGQQGGIMRRVYAESDGTWFWSVSNVGDELETGRAATIEEAKSAAENVKG